jgi:hypothetical protein
MKYAKLAICAALLSGLTLDVNSQAVPTSKALVWTPALDMTDGTPFDESSIELYPLYCDGQYIKDIPNDFTRRYVVDVDLLGPGDHTCAISERVNGIESLVSNTVDFPLGQRTPNAPTLAVEAGA